MPYLIWDRGLEALEVPTSGAMEEYDPERRQPAKDVCDCESPTAFGYGVHSGIPVGMWA